MDFTSVQELKSRTRDKDVLALIQFIEGQREEIKFHMASLEEADRTIKKLEKKVAAKAEPFARCRICFTTEEADHAGWCPKREREGYIRA